MFNMSNGRVEFKFSNGYRVNITNSRSGELLKRKGDMYIYINDTDVTKQFCDSGILKYGGKRMNADQIIKVCNIIKNLPYPQYEEDGGLLIGEKIYRS